MERQPASSVERGGTGCAADAAGGSRTVALTRLQSIGQIAINAKDVRRATAFYRDVLHLDLLFEAGGMAFFNCGGIRLMIGKAERPEFDHPGSILYYRVADIQATASQLREKGVTLEGEPHLIARLTDHDLWMAFLRDSEGNMLALMSEVRP